MPKLVVATYALVAVLCFAGAGLLWIRRKAADMRGHRLPRMRLF